MFIGNYFNNINSKFKKHIFSDLSFNSSSCKKNSIFFAIKGTNLNGNNYIDHAIKKGAKTIISNNKYQGLKKNVLFIRARNVRKLLAEVASKIYKKKPKNLIAVTGTNGKSSIANFYFQLLNLNKKKVASIGTLGVHTLSKKIDLQNTTIDPIKINSYLSKLKTMNIDNVVLEASSHGLKQSRLDSLKFKVGIFTNLSHDHLDYHKSYKDYFNSKLHLFKKLLPTNSHVITDFDIPEYKRIKLLTKKRKLKLNTISINRGDLKVISHEYHGEKQLLKIEYEKKIFEFKLNLIGKIQLKNVLMSMIAAHKSNISFKNIVKVVNKLKPVSGRLEKIGSIKNNSLVILDYAHTPEALQICLKNLKEQFNNKDISIVFGCGGERDKYKRTLMGKIANKYCNEIYLTDDNPRNENPNNIRKSIKRKIQIDKLYEIPNRAKAIHLAIKNLSSGNILIVAGKGHESTQDYGKYKKKFSDKKCIMQSIKKKNSYLSKNIKLNIINESVKNKNVPIKIKIAKGSINSKDLKKNDIFFAIKGKKKDGNLFVKEAFKNGASLAVVNKYEPSQNRNKQIKVNDTLHFLTSLSKKIRDSSKSKTIAITGSCGKTSLKELLSNILKKYGKVTSSPKSFNNKYGVPLSLFNLNLDDDFGVFEVGMDKKGEIDYLSKIIRPDIGVITNISYAHAKNFNNINEIALAKSEIINNIKDNGKLVLNADDKFFNFHRNIGLKKNLKISTFSCFKKKGADVYLNNIKKYKKVFKLNVVINNKKKFFIINSKFENNIKNILASLAIISIFGYGTKLKKDTFYNLKTPEGRGDISKIKINKKNIFLIDESYNSNPLSLTSAIKNFDMINVKPSKKQILLGDMLELGKHSKELHRKIVPLLNSSKIAKINVFGKDIKETFKNLRVSKKGLILKNSAGIIKLIKSHLNNNDYLMIKGSNSTGLNKLTKTLKSGNLNAL